MAATVSLASTAVRYVHWGVIQISVTNLVIIAVMVLLFAAAILLPFPGGLRVNRSGPRP